MDSPTQSPETATALPETVLLGNQDDFGWGQDQYQYQYQNQDQMAFDSFMDPASLVSNMWDADISSGSERFAHDPSIAFGLSDNSHPGPPSLDQISTDGNSKDTRDSLELRRPATEKVNEPPLMGENGPLDCLAGDSDCSSGHPDVKLRSASRKPKNSGCRKQPIPKKALQVREAHNDIEKRYRNRLKGGFERLLAVLPVARLQDATDEAAAITLGQDFSRGQVLDAATEHIIRLEKEVELLKAGNAQLPNNGPNLEERGTTVAI